MHQDFHQRIKPEIVKEKPINLRCVVPQHSRFLAMILHIFNLFLQLGSRVVWKSFGVQQIIIIVV